MYTSLARLLVEAFLRLAHPYILVVIILAAFAGMFGRSVGGEIGKGIQKFVNFVVSRLYRALRFYFPWSFRTGRAAARQMLQGNPAAGSGTPPRVPRWEVDFVGFAFTLLIWGATYVVLFYPWIPVSALSAVAGGSPLTPPPGGGPPLLPLPGGTPVHEQLAKRLADTLDVALARGMGGVEVNCKGYSGTDVNAAIVLLRNPARAAAAGLPNLDVSRSTRLNGFIRVTPIGGSTGPIQDFP